MLSKIQEKYIYNLQKYFFGLDVWPKKWGENRWVTKKMGGGLMDKR